MTAHYDISPMLRAYAEAPLLDTDTTSALVLRAQAGDIAARDRLVLSNMRLVVYFAKQHHYIESMTLEDLVQAGIFGLLKAIAGYDASRAGFSTYASLWIRQAIGRTIELEDRMIRLPTHQITLRNQAQRAASESGALIDQPFSHLDTLSLDMPLWDDEDPDPTCIIDYLAASPDATSMRRNIVEWREIFKSAGLTGREQQVIETRYGLIDESPASLAEIGALLHLSRERVRQVERTALVKLRRSPALQRLCADGAA